jgi:hypothetical protein
MKLYPSLNGRLNNQQEVIREIIATIPERRIREEVIKGKWSIHDNIAHLAKYQPIFIDRIHLILFSHEPSFASYAAENDDDFATWQQWETDQLLEQLDKDRKAIFQLVCSIPEEKLARTGIHKKYGRLTILQWTEFLLLN